jgi:hypothetical protein
MSKPKLVVSFAFALVPLVARGWWAAKTLWLMAPPAYATQMIACRVAHQIAGGTVAIALRLGEGNLAPGRQGGTINRCGCLRPSPKIWSV